MKKYILLNWKVLLPLLLLVGSIGAYAQVIPPSYYQQNQPYANQQQNREILLSIDKFTYSSGDAINVKGYITNYVSGRLVNIDILDPTNKTMETVNAVAAQSGLFVDIINLPPDAVSGKYHAAGYYGNKGAKVYVEFRLIGNEAQASIAIPPGASLQLNKLNFNPTMFTVQAGVPITWINNDAAVHEIASGQLGIANKIFPDGKFDSGIISPGHTYTTSLFDPGNYLYYDKLYPWLVGQLTVTPYTGPASQKPVPPVVNATKDDYLSLTTQLADLAAHSKTLFNDNMSSQFKISKDRKLDNVTISDVKDAKVGKNSMMINVQLARGAASISHDYSANKLQDWSTYNYLTLWFKGQNTKQTIMISLKNVNGTTTGRYPIKDDSSDWKQVQIPLYDIYKNMDMSKVRVLSINFIKGTRGHFKIDNIGLASEGVRTLFYDGMVPLFKTAKDANSDTIAISGDMDAKVGSDSMKIQVGTQSGSASIFHDYSAMKLQNWSHYNYLNLWFKGQNTKTTLQVKLQDQAWKAGGQYNLVDDSSDWKKVQIPLYAVYKNMDMSKVRGINVVFPKGTSGEFLIDDITLSTSAIEPTLALSNGTYISGQTVIVSGNVKVNELGAAVSIRILDPNQGIATVNQFFPRSDNTFSFPLPLSGNKFSNSGTYDVSAQYGLLSHKADASFTVVNPQLATTYKNYGIYNVDGTFYGIPQAQGSFDFNRIEAGQYSTILTNDTLDNIQKTIDEIIVHPVGKLPPPVTAPSLTITVPLPKPVPSFPVPNWVLLQIWQNRTDLQSSYPEVKQGNLTGLKKWAESVGWNQEPRLAALIPNGQTPAYMIQNKTSPATVQPSELNPNLIPTLQVVAAVIAVAIGGVFGYKFYKGRKKLPAKGLGQDNGPS